jgi:hypothetical protein
VNLTLHELSSEAERRLQELFQSKGFDQLVKCLEAEFAHEAHEIKINLVELAFNPDVTLDRTELTKAARLKVALDVLAEFVDPSKTHYDLHCDL